MFIEISDKKWNLKLFPDFYQSNSREPLIAQVSELLNWKFSFLNPSMVSSGAVPRRCHISCILKCSLKSSFHILSLIEIWLFRNNSLFPVGLSNRRSFFPLSCFMYFGWGRCPFSVMQLSSHFSSLSRSCHQTWQYPDPFWHLLISWSFSVLHWWLSPWSTVFLSTHSGLHSWWL